MVFFGWHMTNTEKPKRKGGFNSMSPEMKFKIQSKGGIVAHALGVAHEWTQEEAIIAAQKGGYATRKRNKIIKPSDSAV